MSGALISILVTFGFIGLALLIDYFIVKDVSKETRRRWHSDPKNWRAGVFYYNPEDKRLFPPKRQRLWGWTINLANPLSIAALVLLILAIVWLARSLGG